MALVPVVPASSTVPTLLPGDIPDGAEWESITDMLVALADAAAFAQNAPMARVRRTTTQSIGTASYTTITFDTEDLDDDPAGVGGHSTSSNTSRFTAQYAGWGLCGGTGGFAANATGQRGLRWTKNGSAILSAELFINTTAASSITLSGLWTPVYLDVADYIELQTYQSSGGNLNTTNGSTDQPSLSFLWVRRAA